MVLQPPPELARGNTFNVWFTALPALSGLGSVAYLLAGPPNPITYIAGAFFLVSALGMVVGSLLAARSQNRGEVAQQRWDFLRHLARTRDRVRRTAQAQRLRELRRRPGPGHPVVGGGLARGCGSGGPTDDDFGAVRIGVGPRQLATPLVPARVRPGRGPRAAVARPRCAGSSAPTRAVPELPLTRVAARGSPRSGSAPTPTDPARPARWSGPCSARPPCSTRPTDLIIMVCTAGPTAPDWAWVKWLPHAQHPSEVDCAGPVRLVDAVAAGAARTCSAPS